jgi:hypothetical protein
VLEIFRDDQVGSDSAPICSMAVASTCMWSCALAVPAMTPVVSFVVSFTWLP